MLALPASFLDLVTNTSGPAYRTLALRCAPTERGGDSRVNSQVNRNAPVPMTSLRMEEEGVVHSIDGDIDTRRRLMELGLVPGTRVKRVRCSPLGDPVLYRFRGSSIALRQPDAVMVRVFPTGNM